MAELPTLNHPWMIAVWPGMGHVALNAGIYLLSKLEMRLLVEFEASDFFDVDQVEVKEGLIQPGRRPRNRLFLWQDPEKKRDMIVLLGEAQPPVGKYAFCRHLISYARQMGVERVLTFAAMVTQMHPQGTSRVFGAATDSETLAELRPLGLTLLEDGQIAGLNGVLLGAAAEGGLHGACLLGEMPHVLSQLSFPQAARAILRVFTRLTGITVDLAEISQQVEAMNRQLSELLSQVESSEESPLTTEDEFAPEPPEDDVISPNDRQEIERLFQQAADDRSKAFELKRELDRLGVFKEYEDRFLDLFKHPS